MTTISPATVHEFPWITRDEVFRIETPRLWLVWPRLADAERLQAVAGRQSVAEMTATWPHPLPEGEAGRRIKAARTLNSEGKALILAVTCKGAPDRLIGTIGSGAPAEGVATIGYMLDPAVHGRGLATEAVDAFVRVLFTHARVDGIAATCRVENGASRRVLDKNGFELVRTGLNETKVRGEVLVDFLELSRADWLERLASRRRLIGAGEATPARAGRDISAPLRAKCMV